MQPKSKNNKITGRPRTKNEWTAALLLERADRYFAIQNDHTKFIAGKDGAVEVPDPAPYTVEGLCCYLKINRTTFRNWRQRNDELGEAAELIHQRIAADRIEGALTGRQHAGFAQFILKNTDPEFYRDKVEVENTVAEDAKQMFDAWSQMWKVQK